jgi:hypothetical protein
MWSVSKPVTAVTALSSAANSSQTVGAAVDRAMVDALTRSDNCAQRRVVVAVQELNGGVGPADVAFRNVLKDAGAHASGTPYAAPLSDTSCNAYLASTEGRLSTARVRQPALQFGTYEWTVRDAVTFAYALGTGRYGAEGDQVLRWMRRPKARASEGSPLDYTSPLDLPPSGGRFPAGWQPAYKGGWGGHEQNNFVAEQIVVLKIAGRTVALAAVFRPHVQPPNDDPGTSAAPQALEDVFRALQARLAHIQ